MNKHRSDETFHALIKDLTAHETVSAMDGFIQHGSITCLEHCLHVAYTSYRLCRFLGLDYTAAARGALLHDLFLYDWHTTKLPKGLHAFRHPHIALANATRCFSLSQKEQDIIKKHMWPLTVRFPRYQESLVVSLVDKYCAVIETVQNLKRKKPEPG